MAEPTIAPSVPTSPPSGGGSAAAPAGVSPPSALPASPTTSFADTYKQTAAAAGTPAAATSSTPGATPTTPAATPPVVPTSPVVEETVESLRAKLAAAEAGRISDEDLATMRHFAAIGAEAARRAQQPPVVPPTAPAAFQPQAMVPDPLTGVIPFGDHELAMLSRGADGNVVAEEGAPADLIPRYNAHLRSVAKFQRDFAANPSKYLQPMIQAEAKKIAAAEAQQYHQQTTQEAAAAQIIKENTPWVYQHGPDGKLLYDGYGNPKFTPEGDTWAAVATDLWESGMRDRVKINQIAKRVVLGLGVEHQATQQPQQVATIPAAPAVQVPAVNQILSPIEAEAAMKQRLLQQAQIMAGNAPLTGPAVPVPTAPTTRQTFLQTVKEVNAAQGSPLKLNI